MLNKQDINFLIPCVRYFYLNDSLLAFSLTIIIQNLTISNNIKSPTGRAFDVIGNRKVLNYDRQRKSEEAVIEIKVSNARNEKVDVLLVEHINGDWIIKDESLDYQKKDASTVHFPLSLNAGETKSVYYTYRKEWK